MKNKPYSKKTDNLKKDINRSVNSKKNTSLKTNIMGQAFTKNNVSNYPTNIKKFFKYLGIE
jgi:hypothetical protein